MTVTNKVNDISRLRATDNPDQSAGFPIISQCDIELQRGFTLLELMVAMSIFAMLAVAGWQVFDSVNRARDQAQVHADNLAVLQYAYLQMQQDLQQVVAYQAADASSGEENRATNNNATNNATSDDTTNGDMAQKSTITAKPFMSLDSERVSFVRYADPDPRYQSSPTLQRIEYVFADQRLLRRQYADIRGGEGSVALENVLLENVSAGRWQAYLPELSASFPNEASSNNNQLQNTATANAGAASQNPNATSSDSKIMLIPKGVSISFTYQDMPLTWQWALAPESVKTAKNIEANTNSSNQNNTDNSSNTVADNNTNNANTPLGQ